MSVEAWLRAGILDFLDAGLKVAVPGYLFGEVRGRFLSEEKKHPLSAALGVGYGFTAVEAVKTSQNATVEDKTKLGDLVATLYLSRAVWPALTVYAAPRYIWRQTRNFRRQSGQLDIKETFNDDMVGGGIGLMLLPGERDEAGFMVEYGQVVDTNESDHKQTFVGVGADFRF